MLDEPSLGLAPIVVEEIFELILHHPETGQDGTAHRAERQRRLRIADYGYVLETGTIA